MDECCILHLLLNSKVILDLDSILSSYLESQGKVILYQS